MQLLPVDFLEAQAKDKGLSPGQTETLIQRLGKKGSEQNDAEALCISVNALRTRMTEVYRKFSIGGDGPGKLRRLHDLLLVACQKTNPSLAADTNPTAEPNVLVQTIRAQVYADIKTRCGKMRVLDMEQSIGLGDIYTSVNILEKLSKNQRPPRDEWLKHDPEKFDRFLLGQVHQPGVPGLQAVEEHRQLMILGKPGAGKTTFMQQLAVLCNEGEFQPQRVPIFVTLKEYAEAEGQPKLQTYIQNQWETCGIKETDVLEAILETGQALILLDGLDEVKESDHDRVLKDIKTFTQIQKFRGCQCVMTCRVDALEYMFDSFTYVEIADFDKDQIADFANKWFTLRQDPRKAKIFIDKLNHKDNEPLRKLAVTPILLTLLCLVFEEESEFPKNRSDFYQQEVDWLLKKWDNRRGIKRDLVYKRLSLARKKEMLSQFAFETFERGDYLFKKATVEQHIVRYIRSLPGASEDEDILHLDEEAVLKSITAQHGLLIGRARGFYSFSHLTFQEYFTAQYIVSQTTVLNQALQNLATHITENRYREVFLLTTEMLPKADELFLLMKNYIDQALLKELDQIPKLRDFMAWVFARAAEADLNLNQASVNRTFYFSLSRAYNSTVYRNPEKTLVTVRDFISRLDVRLMTKMSYFIHHDPLAWINMEAKDKFVAAQLFLMSILSKSEKCNLQIEVFMKKDYKSMELDFLQLKNYLNLFKFFLDMHEWGEPYIEIKSQVNSLGLQILTLQESEDFFSFWQEHGKEWHQSLSSMIMRYLNIGHDWSLEYEEKEKLQHYYEANLLLIECLNSDCYVTKATRQYIEDTLLLPLSELEKYPVPDAIANL